MIDEALKNMDNLNELQEKNRNDMAEQFKVVKEEMETAIREAEEQIKKTVPTLLEGGINLKEYFRPELIGIIERHSWYKKLNEKEQTEFHKKNWMNGWNYCRTTSNIAASL